MWVSLGYKAIGIFYDILLQLEIRNNHYATKYESNFFILLQRKFDDIKINTFDMIIYKQLSIALTYNIYVSKTSFFLLGCIT